MTKEQIEAGIIHFQSLAGFSYGLPDRVELYDRAIARLRADLARMEGPAAGYQRIWVDVYPYDPSTGQKSSEYSALVWTSEACAKSSASTGDTVALVHADIPLPRVVEVEGVVDEASR